MHGPALLPRAGGPSLSVTSPVGQQVLVPGIRAEGIQCTNGRAESQRYQPIRTPHMNGIPLVAIGS